ncbi:MAG: hypothetical protein R3F37_22615 [Candidatus Competibacteraceae bacterium]
MTVIGEGAHRHLAGFCGHFGGYLAVQPVFAMLNGTRPVLTNGAGNGVTLPRPTLCAGLMWAIPLARIFGTSVGATISEASITGSGKAFDVNGGGVVNIDLIKVTVTSFRQRRFQSANVNSGSTSAIARVNITTTNGTGFPASSAGTSSLPARPIRSALGQAWQSTSPTPLLGAATSPSGALP